jgi:hypothetical protein
VKDSFTSRSFLRLSFKPTRTTRTDDEDLPVALDSPARLPTLSFIATELGYSSLFLWRLS